MGTEIKTNLSELEKLLDEDFVPKIINNSIFLVWWSDNGWTGKCKEPDKNKACKKDAFGRDCAARERGCSTSYLFKCYGMYVDESLYIQMEVGKYVFFISKNPTDKKYYIIGYFYISDKGEGVSPDCRKWLPKDNWSYYIKGDRVKSGIVYDYSHSQKNIIFDKEFIKMNTTLDLDWNKSTMKNMSDDGKIGSWFRTKSQAISDEDAIKILEIIKIKNRGDGQLGLDVDDKSKIPSNKQIEGVYEILYNELAQDKFHSFEELNYRWNVLKSTEEPQRKEATIFTRWLFEYILRKCKSPYNPRFLKTEKAMTNLLRVSPSLKKEIKNSASNMIGNMVIKRGKTRFEIQDRICLDLTLKLFNNALDENHNAEDIFKALLKKKAIKEIIDNKDYKRISNIMETFPEKLEILNDLIPEEMLEKVQNEPIEDWNSQEDEASLNLITELDARYANKPEFKKIILKQIQRPSALSKAIKEKYGFKCMICGYPGFQKNGGGKYAEVHHMLELNNVAPKTLQSWNLLVVCPLCHKKLHYADVKTEFLDSGWKIILDGEEHIINK